MATGMLDLYFTDDILSHYHIQSECCSSTDSKGNGDKGVFIIYVRGRGNLNSAAESYIPPSSGTNITNPLLFTNKSYSL